MQKTNVSNLKAHLSEFLRDVKSGDTITVMERETPIAKIIPISVTRSRREPLKIRKGTGIIPKPRLRIKLTMDPAKLISEDRDGR
jgi:prevent-host-death family protein